MDNLDSGDQVVMLAALRYAMSSDNVLNSVIAGSVTRKLQVLGDEIKITMLRDLTDHLNSFTGHKATSLHIWNKLQVDLIESIDTDAYAKEIKYQNGKHTILQGVI